MVSFGEGSELSVWARLKCVILQPHAFLAAVSVIAALAQGLNSREEQFHA